MTTAASGSTFKTGVSAEVSFIAASGGVGSATPGTAVVIGACTSVWADPISSCNNSPTAVTLSGPGTTLTTVNDPD